MWVDDSGGARTAVRVADEFARSLGTRLVLVRGASVGLRVMYGVPFESDALQRECLQDAERLFDDVAQSDPGRGARMGVRRA